MNTITDEQLNDLPLENLVSRMDEFLNTAYIERYGSLIEHHPVPRVSDVVNSSLVVEQSQESKRQIAYIAYSFLIQMELVYVTSGISNKVLYNENYNEMQWCSPIFRLRHATLSQNITISSRIAFEVFIDLLHVIENGTRIRAKKSKIKSFRDWLRTPQNRFHYFAHILLMAYKFDREHRTPEVHGTSRIPKRLLKLEMPTGEEQNAILDLTNALINSWTPLVDILNGVRPNYMQIIHNDRDWFDAFMSGDDDAIENKLIEMFETIN
jgi:hypothetical protein